MTEVTYAERVARAGLSRVAEPDNTWVRPLIDAVGAVDTWQLVRTADPALPARVRATTAPRLAGHDPERDLARAGSVGARLVCPGDDEWPAAVDDLAMLGSAPIALWVRGTASLAATARSVAIVGSRAATAYGKHVADEIAGDLGERGWSTVSGAAVGIDAAAHWATLATGTPTVAVLACGVDVAYPKEHRDLLRRIAAAGAVVSESPPGCSPMRHRFLVRNRLLAAQSVGTGVVEAATRSGALNTVRSALKLGRHAMAVPGPVTSAMSGGCHQLLREPGPVLVTNAGEVLDLVGRIGADLAPRQQGPVVVRDQLGDEARRVIEATPVRRYVTPDRIAVAASMPAVRVASLLNQLCAQGLVEVSDEGFRLSAALRRTRHAATTTAGA
jgi:DNA processing protein